jgi:hypothetical protein
MSKTKVRKTSISNYTSSNSSYFSGAIPRPLAAG